MCEESIKTRKDSQRTILKFGTEKLFSSLRMHQPFGSFRGRENIIYVLFIKMESSIIANTHAKIFENRGYILDIKEKSYKEKRVIKHIHVTEFCQYQSGLSQ